MFRRTLGKGALAAVAVAGAWATIGLLTSEPARAGGNSNIRMLGLSKNVKGPIQKDVITYQCVTADIPCPGPRPPVVMYCILVHGNLPFVTNAPCDEVPVGGTLEVHWTIIARSDQGIFGCLRGEFKMTDTCADAVGIHNVAIGEMVGTVGCGTHRTPTFTTSCEQCRQAKHIEGTMRGQFVEGPFRDKQGQICATFAGRTTGGNWVVPGALGATGVKLSLDGVYEFPCPN